MKAGAQPSFAQPATNCIQDVWKAPGNKQNLTFTANDVTRSQATDICVSDDVLFDRAPRASADDLKSYAEHVGLDLAKFDACVASGRTKDLRSTSVRNDGHSKRWMGGGRGFDPRGGA